MFWGHNYENSLYISTNKRMKKQFKKHGMIILHAKQKFEEKPRNWLLRNNSLSEGISILEKNVF